MIYLQYFKAISIEISKHHETNPGFNSGPQWSRQAVSTYLSGWDSTHVGWNRHQSCCGGVIGHLKFKSI